MAAGKFASKLHNANILILGGTSGIGFGVAEAAYESGAMVTISGTNQAKIDTKTAEIKSNNSAGDASKLRGYPCDLGDQEKMEGNLKALFDFATNNGERKLDHVVFCAGDAPAIRKLEEMDVAYVQRVSMIRFAAPVVIAKLITLHSYLNSSPSSSITLTSGINTAKLAKGWAVGAGVGGAVEGTARGLAVDLAPIRVNCVAPGAVHTELFDKVGAENLEGMLAMFKDKSMTKTVGKPEDVAEAYLYCMRDRFVTGSLIESNGGGLLA
ncbi:hypothetical protein EPUS_03231 [Endocarpon pusillum Z07020]|uniref:Uncharacterized protein n=1 Tax=Endocarpon pusillum (strain Z07020 / HMAS-L-300199) TaxID=1263415 RepID=U1GBC5_ENDPU|nr:uncharacterized protein EPUS_03231 [Endocarpon pusillum Z07020]ERF74847.1 hypothetical protein EPUS_03231 [Endocarpon pusillum Z07020]